MTGKKQRKQKPIRKKPIPERLQGQVYLDPRFDTGFKELFDSEDALKDFLNGVLQLEGDDKIKNLTFTFDKTNAEGGARLLYRQGYPIQGIPDYQRQTGNGTFQGILGTLQSGA